MTKRRKFLITSFLLSAGFTAINFLDNQYRFIAIGLLTVLTLILFVWSLWEGLGRNATLLTLILPTTFTLGVGLFWFLLPSSIYARVPVIAFYGFGIYALCSTANIFTVSATKTIALVRAAKGAGFVLTLITLFLVFDAILSVKAPIWITSGLIFLSSIPLFMQGLWTSALDTAISRQIISYSVLFALGVGEISLLLYFWPVTVVVGSLFLTIAVYVLLGLGQASLEGRLFKATVRDYLFVGSLVFLAMFIITRWGG